MWPPWQPKVNLTSGHSGSVLVLHPLVPGTQNLIFSSWEYANNYDHDASLAWPKNTGFDASKINMILVGHVHPEQGDHRVDPVDPDGDISLCIWGISPTIFVSFPQQLQSFPQQLVLFPQHIFSFPQQLCVTLPKNIGHDF